MVELRIRIFSFVFFLLLLFLVGFLSLRSSKLLSIRIQLRLLFEVAPLGFLVEKAGGYSSDGNQSVLNKVINNLDDRTQVAYGSKEEIIRFEETLYGSSRIKGAPVGAMA